MNIRMIFLRILWIPVLIILIILYDVSTKNYLLFHGLVEMFSIGISSTIFILVWNSKHVIKNNYTAFIGVSYLFIAILDILHTLSYQGMNVFKDYDFYANQIWIATRFLEALTMFLGFYFLTSKSNFEEREIEISFVIFSIITFLIIMSIFYWKTFPICFVKGEGLTEFKKISEYIISAIFIINIFLLKKYKSFFNEITYKYLLLSLVFYVITEIAFSLYISNFGFLNIIGHYFKIFAFYFLYKAIVEKYIKEPYNTVFKQLEDAKNNLEKKNSELIESHLKITKANEELIKKEDELIRVNKTKDKFFSIIAHDLKGPIGNGAILFEMIVDKINKISKEELNVILNETKDTMKNLYDLLFNLLNWALIQKGEMIFNPVIIDSKTIILNCLKVLRPAAELKKIKIIYDENISVPMFVDHQMIITVLRNLISNSIKFTNEYGVISIIVKKENLKIMISIKDTGVGMRKETIEKLFRIDEKVTTAGTKDEKGTGLGLILCKEFVEKNGGKIYLNSEIGKGTTFTVELPSV